MARGMERRIYADIYGPTTGDRVRLGDTELVAEVVQAHVRATKADPWDGRMSREEAFIAHLKDASPASEIKNLDPILDAMRAVKSPREIAVIREATRLAGLGIMEAMRDAKPGMHEYELEAPAEYVYKRGGAYGESYFPLIADGPNMPYSHYHKDRAVLKDGDLVQFDWAPDWVRAPGIQSGSPVRSLAEPTAVPVIWPHWYEVE
jgi:Xaa-Pro aminopeptidase